MLVDREFLDAVFGDAAGFAHFTVGHQPYRKSSGACGFDRFQPLSFRWPDRADDALRQLDEATAKADCDLFVCPNLLTTDRRVKNTAVTNRLLHADADNGVTTEKLASLNAFTVASGRPGHLHVYVPLAREVTPSEYRRLQRGMRQFFNGDSKISDNDLLRPVGSANHKAVVLDGLDRPYEVLWEKKPSGLLVEPAKVAEILGLTPESDAYEGETYGFDAAWSSETEAVDLSKWPSSWRPQGWPR